MKARNCWIAITGAFVVLASLAVLFSPGCHDRPVGVGGPNGATRPATAATEASPKATLTVVVKELGNHQGKLIFGVFKSAEGFPKEEKHSVAWEVRAIDADTMTFTARLTPGIYAASVLHDENDNGQMDFGAFGVPKEGYGVTN